MSEQTSNRGAAEERTGVPETPGEHNEPASPSSPPAGSAAARGASEEAADTPRTE